MGCLTLPLQITNGEIAREKNIKESIDAFLSLLIASPQGGCVAERDFGFIFNNLRFEILNESEGVIYDSMQDEESSDVHTTELYEKKISGSSKNLNTFAAELKESIRKYEKRLQNPTVSMTYIREERLIYVTVKGIIAVSGEKYQYTTTIRIWN